MLLKGLVRYYCQKLEIWWPCYAALVIESVPCTSWVRSTIKRTSQAIKDKDGKNNIKQFQTRSKHTLEISDEKGKGKISLKTGKGAEFVFDDKASKVHIKIKGLMIEMDGKDKSINSEIKG